MQRVRQDDSGTIINNALRCLTVGGSNHAQLLLNSESNAEEQDQYHNVSFRNSNSSPRGVPCASESGEGSLSGDGSSRSVFDSGREG
jgi:hypothetical protein